MWRRLSEITDLIHALRDQIAAVCAGIYKILADVFSACWAHEDAAAESADAQNMRSVRDEAISALAPLRLALDKYLEL